MKIIKKLYWMFVLSATVAMWLMGCDGGDNGDTTPSHTHTWGEWTVRYPATCDAPGVEIRTCIESDTTERRPIQQLTGAACAPNNCGKDGTANFCKSVVIGGQTWLAENLNYQTGNSWCYNDSSSYCNKYGRLYDWETAKRACPSGWHLPTRDEWGALAKAAGGTGDYGASGTAGTKLKSRNGWNSNGNGTDDYGFSALPGGHRISSDGFGEVYFDGSADYGTWWTATDFLDFVYYRGMDYNLDYVIDDDTYKNIFGFSVRCIKD
jgi:uncharacterized protein (TIGR02145 family)